MTIETTDARHRVNDDHEAHEANYADARASALEKGFIWIAWALAAAFVAFTMSLYIPGFLRTDPGPDAAAPPASAANPVP